jgi:3-phosphoinositide dependent protein kinase-1
MRACSVRDVPLCTDVGEATVLARHSQVRHKGTGAEYALKMVDKHLIVRHRMVGHIKQERNILDECDYPGIARLYFTFQVLQAHHQ